MIKNILLLTIILTKLLNAALVVEDAENAARRGNIEEFRQAYVEILDPEKDKILIPAIRQNGNLDSFYISLVRNGNLDELARLMGMDGTLTKDVRSNVFNATLTIYKSGKDTWDEDKSQRYRDFMSMHVDYVDEKLQVDYRCIVLEIYLLPQHSFTVEQQVTFIEASQEWFEMGF